MDNIDGNAVALFSALNGRIYAPRISAGIGVREERGEEERFLSLIPAYVDFSLKDDNIIKIIVLL